MRRCLICDDHPLLREALAGAIELEWPSADVVQAGDFPQAWASAEGDWDVIICDLLMPGATPVEGIARLRSIAPQTPLIVLTGTEGGRMILDLYQRGIAGFVPKAASSAVFLAAIHLVLSGGTYIPPEVLSLADDGSQPGPDHGHHGRLTGRQRDVLALMAEGQSNKEIARTLDLSPATVKTHAAAAFAALGAANRTEAVMSARIAGLI